MSSKVSTREIFHHTHQLSRGEEAKAGSREKMSAHIHTYTPVYSCEVSVVYIASYRVEYIAEGYMSLGNILM